MAQHAIRSELKTKLEELVRNAMDTYSYENAIFYAEKLLSLEKSPASALLLAKAYYGNGEYARALNVLQRNEFVPGQVSHGDCFKRAVISKEIVNCVLLAARCLEHLKDWAKCLQMLSCFDTSLSQQEHNYGGVQETIPFFGYRSVVYSLAGRCYEELEKKPSSRNYYEKSLQEDPFNWEAYYRLVDVHFPADADSKGVHLTLALNDNPTSKIIKDLFSCKLSYWTSKDSLIPKYSGTEDDDWTTEEGTMIMPEEVRLAPYFGWSNIYIQYCRAERMYYGHYINSAYEVSKQVLEEDPFHEQSCVVHTAALVSLSRKTDLFQLGHEISDRSPNSSLSWFVVGAYYYTIEDYDKAGKYFYKATIAGPSFLPAWIAYGHTFHSLEEGEHTVTAYRSAQRMFPGCHLAALYMGMEHVKSSNLQHAYSFLRMAKSISQEHVDPLIYNEMGVTLYRSRKYEAARDLFLSAISNSPVSSWAVRPGVPVTDVQKVILREEGYESGPHDIPNSANAMRGTFWEPTIFNLAHCMRKLRCYSEALHYYFISLAIKPHQASVFTAIGFTYHLMGRLDDAIQYYHMSLSVKSNDTFTRDMLNKATKDSFAHGHPSTASSSPPSLRPSILSTTSPPLVPGRLSSASQNWEPMVVDPEPLPELSSTPIRRLQFPIQQG
eukprot:TRINITY_DN21016_c1_g4_i1.p1 TRINITY_DN21016_c1_g4~~TRINITY_DN21016_c1_g4_i1.p1  ORF type:complete len:687 (+),score=77.06 TRINITY_DN21016_c1_g4_i1:72-2063(+)